MPTRSAARRQSDPAVYCIQACGRFPEAFPEHFGGFAVEARSDTAGRMITQLTGAVADQTALLSLLQYLDDAGLVLITVEDLDRAPRAFAGDPTPTGGMNP